MYIVFEGGEGTGKGTQIKMFVNYLHNLGYETLLVREPGGNNIGEALREIILSTSFQIDPITEILLFSANRSHLSKFEIAKALEEGKVVISDRSFLSTLAHQHFGHGVDRALIETLTNIAVGTVLPELTFVLDIPHETGLDRKKQDGEENRVELKGLNHHQKVRQGYLELCRECPDRNKLIDATGTIEAVFDRIKTEFELYQKSI